MVPGSFGCGWSLLAAIAMLAPSRAARVPIARPMPRDAPVMNRVLPLRDMAAPRGVTRGQNATLAANRRPRRSQNQQADDHDERLPHESAAAAQCETGADDCADDVACGHRGADVPQHEPTRRKI